jgi:hypothetical protein
MTPRPFRVSHPHPIQLTRQGSLVGKAKGPRVARPLIEGVLPGVTLRARVRPDVGVARKPAFRRQDLTNRSPLGPQPAHHGPFILNRPDDPPQPRHRQDQDADEPEQPAGSSTLFPRWTVPPEHQPTPSRNQTCLHALTGSPHHGCTQRRRCPPRRVTLIRSFRPTKLPSRIPTSFTSLPPARPLQNPTARSLV